MSESGSPAESLLSFLNTASSSVKNVLARPGCFKRNTNHRRFLQKQLRVTTRGSETVTRKQEISKKQFALSKVKQRNSMKRRTEESFPDDASLRRTLPPRKRINTTAKEQYTAKRNVIATNEVQNELQYLDECKRFSAMVDDLVDNLLDSSSQGESNQRLTNETSQVSSHSYTRSGSISSSYSSASEEEIIPDFMSGEELVRSLDISELFIPEGHSSPVEQRCFRQEPYSDNDYQMVPGNDSPVHEEYMYETDLIDVQGMPVFENVFRQFSL